jgi:hypothetical protein
MCGTGIIEVNESEEMRSTWGDGGRGAATDSCGPTCATGRDFAKGRDPPAWTEIMRRDATRRREAGCRSKGPAPRAGHGPLKSQRERSSGRASSSRAWRRSRCWMRGVMGDLPLPPETGATARLPLRLRARGALRVHRPLRRAGAAFGWSTRESYCSRAPHARSGSSTGASRASTAEGPRAPHSSGAGESAGAAGWSLSPAGSAGASAVGGSGAGVAVLSTEGLPAGA